MNTERAVAEPTGADDALRQSDQRYRELLAAVTDYVYSVVVEEGRAVKTQHGPGCEAVTGYTPAEFARDPMLWFEMVCPGDRPRVVQQAQAILDGAVPPALEHRIRHKNGSIRWIRNTAVPQRDQAGRLRGYDGVVSDITERKRAEHLLRVQYAVTRELSQATTLPETLSRILRTLCHTFGCLPWDLGVFWGVNPGGTELTCQQLVNSESPEWEPFERQVRAWRIPAGQGLAGRAWSGGEPVWVGDLARQPEGAELPQAQAHGLHGALAFPLLWEQQFLGVVELFSGEPVEPDAQALEVLAGVGAQLGQFIERKKVEEQRQLSEQRLQAILDHSPAMIHLKDLQGRYLLVNRRFEELLGVRRAEVVGKTPAEVLAPDAAALVRAHDQQVISAQAPLEFEETVVLQGVARTYMAVKFPLLEGNGAPYATCGILTDITERKQAEEELKRACGELARSEDRLKRTVHELKRSHRKLQAAQFQLIQAAKMESVGTLAAGVAHEVKNPLQTIIMGLDYLKGNLPAPDANLNMVLRDMREAVERANAIIRELLQFSAASQFSLRPEDINELVNGSLHLIRAEAVAALIKVQPCLAADLPPVELDRGKMQQVLINLFLNALQAMSQGGTLTVTTRLERGRPARLDGAGRARPGHPKATVIIEVQDTGPGIDPADLPKVFDPFFTTKPVGHGTGLGLSVVKKIVELHHGTIQIENRPEGGVTVTLALGAKSEHTNEHC